MKIDIPDEYIKKIILVLLDELNPSPFSMSYAKKVRIKPSLKKYLVDQILEKYKDKIEWPEITREDIKKAALDKLADEMVDKFNNE